MSVAAARTARMIPADVRPRSSAVALALFEAKVMMRHPAWLLGTLSAGLLVMTSGLFDPAPGGAVVDQLTWGLSMFPVPIAVFFALLGARSAFNQTDELESATSGGAVRRHTSATVLLVVPVLFSVGLALIAGVLAELAGTNHAGMFSGRYADESMLVIAQIAAATWAMAGFGLAAGSWFPHRVTAAVMIFIVLQGAETGWHPAPDRAVDGIVPQAWHVAYGSGVAMLVTAAALAKHRRDLVCAVIAAAGLILTVVGGTMQ